MREIVKMSRILGRRREPLEKDDEASARLSEISFFFPVFGQQPEDSDGFHRKGFENGCTRGIRLEGSQPPTRARPRTWPSG